MANKMLGKVVAGAALGGASLLVFSPAIAYADGHHGEDEGKVFAKPHAVRAGDEVKLLEICPEAQEHAFVWSKVTGKVKLHPAREDRGEEHGGWKHEEDADQGPDGKDRHGREEEGRGEEQGKDEHGKDEHGKDEHGKGEDHGKGEEQGKDEHQPPFGGGQPPAPGGKGGGMAADDSHDWKGHEEAGQGDEYGRDGKMRHESDYGQESGYGSKKDHGDYGQESGYGSKKGHGSEYGEESEYGSHKEYGQEYEYGRYSDKGHEHYGMGDEYGRGADESGWEHEKDFVYYGEAQVSEDARPGTYELKGSCGEGELVVLPKGHVEGGDGGMTTTSTDRSMAAGGAGMIGAAALGGIVLMRRRRANGLV